MISSNNKYLLINSFSDSTDKPQIAECQTLEQAMAARKDGCDGALLLNDQTREIHNLMKAWNNNPSIDRATTILESIKNSFPNVIYSNGGAGVESGFEVQANALFHIDDATREDDEAIAVISTAPTTIFATSCKARTHRDIPSNEELIKSGLCSLAPGVMLFMFCNFFKSSIIHSTPHELEQEIIEKLGCEQIKCPKSRAFMTFSLR